jgi:hypothetical protein
VSDIKTRVTWELKAAGVREAGDDLKGLGSEAEKATGGTQGLTDQFALGALKAQAIGVAIQFVVNTLKSLPEAITHVTNLNTALFDNATMAGMVVEQHQALDYVFRQAGGGAGSATTAIRAMTTALNAAESEGSRKRLMLNSLGLEYQALKDMHPEAAFYEISRAINTLSTEQEKNMALTEIFGGRYSQVIGAAMRQSGGDIEDATRLAIEHGLVIRTQTVEAWKEYSNAQTETTQIMDRLKSEGLEPMLPVLHRLIDLKTGLAKEFIPAATEAASNFAFMMSETADVLEDVVNWLGLAKVGCEDLPVAIRFTINPIGQATSSLFESFGAMRRVKEANEELIDSYARSAESTRMQAIVLTAMNEELDLTPHQLRLMRDELEGMVTIDTSGWVSTLNEQLAEMTWQSTGALGVLSQYTLEELNRAVAIRQVNIGLLQQWEAMGKVGPAMADRIARIREEIAMLKEQAASLGVTVTPATFGRADLGDEPDLDPKEAGITKADAMAAALRETEAMNEQHTEDMQQFRWEKEAQFQDMLLEQEQAAWQRRYDIGMHYMGMMSNMLVSSWGNDFKDIEKQFGAMLKRMAMQMAASGVLTLGSQLLGGGAVGIFGQIFGGGKK